MNRSAYLTGKMCVMQASTGLAELLASFTVKVARKTCALRLPFCHVTACSLRCQQVSLLAAFDLSIQWRASATAKASGAVCLISCTSVKRPLADSKCTNALKVCSCAHGCVCAGRSRG